VCLFRFTTVFCVSLDHFIPVLFGFVVGFRVFGTSEEFGWEERLRNDLFYVDWDV